MTIPALLWSIAGVLLPQEQAAAARPYPTLITERTRKDAAALQALERPGEVLFADGFESEQSFQSWFELLGLPQGRVRIARAPEQVHAGSGALELTATDQGGRSCGASAIRWLGDEGHDCVHLRYWIRYADDYDQGNLNHTGGEISGVAGSFKWTGMGTAGKRPLGDDHFSTRVEGWRDWQRIESPGALIGYTYWMDMKRERDGNFWGNMMGPEANERFVPKRSAWLCVEQRVAVNTPGKDDGELAVWLDGVLYFHYEGFRWRSTADVKCKRIGLLVYVHQATRDNTVWFDDVVVSTGYIGTGEPQSAPK
jgi:hypothetical protein